MRSCVPAGRFHHIDELKELSEGECTGIERDAQWRDARQSKAAAPVGDEFIPETGACDSGCIGVCRDIDSPNEIGVWRIREFRVVDQAAEESLYLFHVCRMEAREMCTSIGERLEPRCARRTVTADEQRQETLLVDAEKEVVQITACRTPAAYAHMDKIHTHTHTHTHKHTHTHTQTHTHTHTHTHTERERERERKRARVSDKDVLLVT